MDSTTAMVNRLVVEQDGHRYTCHVRSGGDLCIESCDTYADVLTIPEELDGRPVAEFAEESFAGLSNVRSIVCPAHVKRIGRAAFRNCSQLERIVLPFDELEFREMWFEGCTSLREMAVPGCTGIVSLNSVRGVHVNRVNVGARVRDISVPRVPDAYLGSIVVDDANPWISSDGTCLYDASGETLIKCICTARRYEVAAGCRAIGPEAFAYNKDIEEIVLPEGLESIGEGAFESSSLRAVYLPDSLRAIGESAFSNCKRLEFADLNEGLARVERHAFRGCTSLRKLRVPSSVSHLDSRAFEGCAVDAGGAIEVSEGNPTYSIDASGVLYERDASGYVLLKAIGDIVGDYEVRVGTHKIAARAFFNSSRLTSVELPQGLLSIGRKAFSGCRSLVRADLPDTLKSLGESAFMHTGLERLRLPAALSDIGEDALCTSFEHATLSRRNMRFSGRRPGLASLGNQGPDAGGGQTARARQSCTIDVDDANERYCLVSGFVCERLAGATGKLRALWYAGTGEDVVVPPEISTIGQNAVVNASRARSLWLHEGLHVEGRHAVQILHPLESIHVLSRVGIDDCILHPAPSTIGIWSQNHVFEFEKLDVRLLAHDCDEMLFRHPRGFERTWRIVDRLTHPRLMDDDFRHMFEDDVLGRLDEIVADFARRNYLAGARQLVESGLIGPENITQAVNVACAADGVAVTAFLLEAKRLLEPGDCAGFDDLEL